MKISYPIRDTDGKEFSSQDEVMRLIDGESHGTWLLGANNLWHGGIHISDVSNPFSALNPDAVNTGEPVPLQFMADGTIVAYRLNNDYLSALYCGQQLRYSSSFVLVKSQCKPDPQKEKSWLEFYSLYMHLAPVADYPASPCYKVREGHSGILLRQYKNGQNGLPEGEPDKGESGAWPAPAKTKKSLNAGDRFVSSRTGRFYVTKNGKASLTSFGLVRLLKGNIPGNEQYWVTLDPELMEPDGEIQELMPGWMQRAKEKGSFDAVQLTGETEEWTVSAGTPVGFMGCMESPGEGKNLVEKEWFVHLEVLSTDPNMPGFLANPERVKGDKKSVLVPNGKSLFIRQDEEGQPTFTPTSARLSAQCLFPRESTTPVTDESQQWWYKVTGSGWLPQSDLEEVGQYDLLKLGFLPLEENSGGDVMNSPYESWVPEAFGAISQSAEQSASYQYGLVSQFYRDLMSEMDSNRDGKVTAEEIRQALAVRDPLVKNVVNRLAVKHHSEWCKGRSTGRWEEFYKDLDPLEMKYCEKWQADLEWMSKVPPFDKDEAVWHFHPVVFLTSLKTEEDCAQLIWGEIVNQRLGAEKACEFRKKVVRICADLWGEEKKIEFANSLMACMAVETSRLFSSSVVKLMPKYNSQGVALLNSKGKPIREYRPLTKQEINADPNLAAQNAVGLIQFTGPAVNQINRTHGLSVTKQKLALMDEIEQLDYVKLYFTSNTQLFNKIKSADDIYLYIFCPAGVGQNDDFVLYSRQKDEDEKVNYYQANSSLDSSEHNNKGNNDGAIQRYELLSRLNNLRDEGEKFRNKCLCKLDEVTMTKEPSGPQWVNRFPNSSSISDLTPAFSASVNSFIQAIRNAGGSVRVSATYRPEERAYLMHYSWKIAREGMDPALVPEKDKVNIDWTHKGNHDAAVAAAAEMVNGYEIVFRPALTSRHIQKRAIDMTITGIINKSMNNSAGVQILITSQSVLYEVGATYGVYKLVTDPPHWSDDGR